jgi:hypothetical protein
MAGALTAAIAAAFAGSAAPSTDDYFEYTTLLLPGNGTNGAQNNTFLDGSTNNFTITRNGNTTQGTFSPFSQTGWSGSFNTSTTYLTVTDTSNLRFGSSNFTIEAFVYRAASGATQTIASKGASTPTGWVFQISSADKLVFTDTSTSITGATSLAANTWYYVAVVRAGTGSNQTTLYVNAVSDATGTSATTFSQTDNMKIGADRSNTNFANGYISNLRLSNTNRTISSTPTSALAADSNTIFLGLYNNRFQYTDSTAAFTNMTVTGTPSVQAFSPFNPTSSWSATTNGGSGYFDGNGDSLTGPTNTATAYNFIGDFTIESWCYFNSVATGYAGIVSWADSGGWNGWQFLNNAGIITFQFLTGSAGAGTVTSSTTVTTGQWYHIAVVRSGSTITLYLNGLSVGTVSYSSSQTSASSFIKVAADRLGTSLTTGYLASIRVVNGTAVYSGTSTTTPNFTLPTAPLTAITNTSLLLNFTNAGIYDATSKNDLETVGNAQISTAISAKWGSGSMYFDGTVDFLNTLSTWAISGSEAYTLEAWIYPTTVSGDLCIYDTRSSSGTGFVLFINSTGKLQIYDTTGMLQTASTTTLTANTWTYIAMVRSAGSSTNTFYVNGTSAGTFTLASFAAATNARIGARNDALAAYNGYMQDFRITKGYARIITASPTAAFPTL